LETNPRRRKALTYLTKIKTLKTASCLSHDELRAKLLSLKKIKTARAGVDAKIAALKSREGIEDIEGYIQKLTI
jgi:hypothetical protein